MHIQESGYFTHQYINKDGNRKWKLYAGTDSSGILVSDELEWHQIKKVWIKYVNEHKSFGGRHKCDM